MSYWDSAYIAKFYLDEPESDRIRALAGSQGQPEGSAPVVCSRFGYLEVTAVFHRKLREGAIRPADLQTLLDQLEADDEAGLWTWLPVSQAVLQLAASRFRRLPKGVFLRSGDALHLATAEAHGIRDLYSNDERVLRAARHFGVSASHPAVV